MSFDMTTSTGQRVLSHDNVSCYMTTSTGQRVLSHENIHRTTCPVTWQHPQDNVSCHRTLHPCFMLFWHRTLPPPLFYYYWKLDLLLFESAQVNPFYVGQLWEGRGQIQECLLQRYVADLADVGGHGGRHYRPLRKHPVSYAPALLPPGRIHILKTNLFYKKGLYANV